ncbi:AAA family ATPase [Actinokineospora bangkokensis]|uniref:HTH luxR-type domain-containing protein n=1 Tax=Actinokineospora bangkokensis TaxID=1193682 RepID=A0A1Q9LNH5_9PSEU|nr:LuxR family transcriptional regulator [Actinokineospora bangkokensis]OLR93553.1 hypothetical protein BJP25_14760 [Actinokineospora bangkokensis]
MTAIAPRAPAPGQDGQAAGAHRALVERDEQVAALAGLVRGVLGGRSGLALVAGAPGSGRTALVERAAGLAEDLGVPVLRARGTSTESCLPHGLVSQLVAALPPERARHVLEPLWADLGPVATDHAVVGRLLDAVDRGPALVLLDDVHLADPQSQAWTRVLLRRLRGSALLVVAVGAGRGPAWLHEECAVRADDALLLDLRPLSRDGVAALLRGRPEAGVGAPALHAATGGSPGLIADVLAEGPVDDLRRRARAARAARAERAVAGLRGAPLALLRARSAAGTALEPSRVRGLAGLSARDADVAGRHLVDLALLPADPGAAPDPAVAERALAGMDRADRRDLFGRAAELAHRWAAPDVAVARLLLEACPVGRPWAQAALRAGAARRRGEGDTRGATRFLQRALAEPLPEDARRALVLELAAVETSGASSTSDLRLARVILDRATAEDTRVRLAAADSLLVRGATTLARRVLSTEPPGSEDDDLAALRLLAEDLTQHPGDGPARPWPARGWHSRPAQAGVAAWLAAVEGRDAARARDLARVALAGRLRAGFDGALLSPRITAARALMLTDDVLEARQALDATITDARRRGARSAAALALVARAQLHLQCGRPAAAEEDAAAAGESLPHEDWHPSTLPLALGLQVMLALGADRPDDAERAIAAASGPPQEDGYAWSYLLFTRGALELRLGRPRAALDHFRECGRRMRQKGWHNPAVLPWRSLTAVALRRAGIAGPIDELLAADLARASAWGTPACVGQVHLWAGQALTGAAALRRLAEGVAALERSPARDWHLQALLALAGARLDAGQVAEVDRHLAQAERLARLHRLDGHLPRIRELGRRFAERTGAEVSRLPGPGSAPARSALPVAARDVADLVVRGLSNGEIARALDISKRTVEQHLTRIYRIYGVEGRSALRALLAPSDEVC